MKKSSEYRHHAAECRALAQRMKDDNHRAQLLLMANTWESLADDRERRAQASPGLASAGAASSHKTART
jgi:hypothetical protein